MNEDKIIQINSPEEAQMWEERRHERPIRVVRRQAAELESALYLLFALIEPEADLGIRMTMAVIQDLFAKMNSKLESMEE